MENKSNNGFSAFMITTSIALGLLYLGGWTIAWSEFIATKKSLYIGHGLAIDFNNRFYGFLFKPRFFDSPVISWIMGIIAISTLSSGMKALSQEDSEDEDSNQKDAKDN